MNKLLLASSLKEDKPIIDFTIADLTNGSNANFFSTSSNFNTSDYDVYINGTKTSQAFNSLTFNANDRIQIKANKKVNFYPYFYTGDMFLTASVKSINSALPLMSKNNTAPITDCVAIFSNWGNLSLVSSDLFRYNPQITSFERSFENCHLTSIPQELFKYNTQVTSFFDCFNNCRYLTSIPQDLFRYNLQITNFIRCFYSCDRITSNVPELWVTHPNANGTDCFDSCSSAANYALIPNSWK